MDQVRWQALPQGTRDLVLQDLEGELLSSHVVLVGCKSQDELMRLQGQVQYISKKLETLRAMQEERPVAIRTRNLATGY